MKVHHDLLAEIYGHLEHGDVQRIATQLGLLRTKVNRELTTLKSEYRADIINAAINRIEGRKITLLHKHTLQTA